MVGRGHAEQGHASHAVHGGGEPGRLGGGERDEHDAGDRGGIIDIGFHRDDVGQRAELPRLGPSSIPWDINDHDIVLVDDILHTGRTARAALNALFDWGRPRSVTLAVLVDLPGR